MRDQDLTNIIHLPGTYGYTSVVSGAAINTIPTAIKDGTLQADLSLRGDSGSTCTYYCRWEDAGTLETFLLTANNFSIAGYSVMFGMPHQIQTGFYCDHIHVSPVEPNTGILTYRYAELQCTFKPHVFDPGSPILLKRYALEPCGMVLSIPPNSASAGYTVGLVKINNQQPVPNEIYIPLVRYTVTVFNVLNLPEANINSVTRTLNNAPFATHMSNGSTGVTYAKGLCLYEGITQVERTVTNQGADRMNVTHQWIIGPVDQNMVPNWDLFKDAITDIFATVWVLPDQLQYKYGNHALLGV